MGGFKIIELKPITLEKDIYRLWKIGLSTENPEWSKYNGFYFNDYKSHTFENFLNECTFYKKTEDTLGIFINNALVEDVSRY